MRKELSEETRTIELISIRFPDKRGEIEQSFENNIDFQELCEDYLEVTVLLDNCCRQTIASKAEVEVYCALLKYLESEIEKSLQSQQKHFAGSARSG
jgi:hypothetical protein